MSTITWREKHAEEMRKYRREWYYRNKKHALGKIKERQRELRLWLEEKKKSMVCETCGNSHIACLQFHHTDPKKKEVEVVYAAKRGWSKERIEVEIKKCKVLCANCHAILHWEERQKILQQRQAKGR